MRTGFDHLPPTNIRDLELGLKILFEEFDDEHGGGRSCYAPSAMTVLRIAILGTGPSARPALSTSATHAVFC